MSDLLLSHLVWLERLDLSQLQQRRLQGFQFLSTSLGAYLDTGDTVVFKYPVKIAPPFSVETKIGSILAVDTQQNLLNQSNIRFCSNPSAFPLHTQWIQVNWWILSHDNNNTDPFFPHVAIPLEIIRTSYVQWIPLLYISDIAFIFHIQDVLHGKYANTHGLKNVFVCRSFWDFESNQDINSVQPHPYFSIFDLNIAESYIARVWGLIEKVQHLILSTMRRRGDSQKLHYSESIALTGFEWKILKSRFHSDCCFFNMKATQCYTDMVVG